jgi:hypothetical protein
VRGQGRRGSLGPVATDARRTLSGSHPLPRLATTQCSRSQPLSLSDRTPFPLATTPHAAPKDCAISYDILPFPTAKPVGSNCALTGGNLCTHGWRQGPASFADVLPPTAVLTSVKVEADGTACTNGAMAYLNGAPVGAAALAFGCTCFDCGTKAWTDAGPVLTSAGAYVLGGGNTVSFSGDFFAYSAIKVTVGYQIGVSATCLCQPGYAFNQVTNSCTGGWGGGGRSGRGGRAARRAGGPRQRWQVWAPLAPACSPFPVPSASPRRLPILPARLHPCSRPPDVDECALGTVTCAPHATCSNTPGGAACTCDAGYVGDGKLGCSASKYWPLDSLPSNFTW